MPRGDATAVDLASLQPLFRPRSVAVIGASAQADKIGGRPLHYLLAGGFDGAVWPVNPAHPTIQGRPAFASVAELPETPDLAVVAVPAAGVAGVLEACAARGVPGAVIFSSGFAEVGGEGVAMQARIADIARAGRMRVIGPNCLGIAHFARAMIASFSPAFADGYGTGGRIGLVSQSGAFGGWAFGLARARGLALSLWATTGNEADVELADCLAFLAQDPETGVILAYLEGCRNGPKLLAALELARANRKPVVVVKVGRTEVGAAAAASHTAALAGGDAVYDAVFRQAGAYRADDLDEFFDVAYAAAIAPLPANDRVALISVSGGVGVLMADEAVRTGLDVTPLPEPAQAAIRRRVPFAGTRNPLDITGQIVNDRGLLGEGLDLILRHGDYGSIAAFQAGVTRSPEHARPNLELWRRVRAAHPGLAVSICAWFDPEVRNGLEQAGCLTFEEPNRAVRALAALARFRRAFDRPAAAAVAPLPVDLPALPWTEARALLALAEAGVPVVEHCAVAGTDEAAAAAAAIAAPVAVKVLSPSILHKTEIGGVALDLATPEATAEAYTRIMATVAARAPEAVLQGCLVSRMEGRGIETILGVQNDPVFGPLIMVGLGGVFVEALRDVSLRVAPVDEAEAHRMIAELRGLPVLQGLRGQPPADLDALARAIAALSRFAVAVADRVVSIDVNPFLVRPRGAGAVALDAVLVPK